MIWYVPASLKTGVTVIVGCEYTINEGRGAPDDNVTAEVLA
jgi:hypothetical protein